MNESGLDKKATLHEQKSSEVLTYQHKYTVLKFKQNVSFRANKIIAQKFEFSIPPIFLYLSQIFEFFFFLLGIYTKILEIFFKIYFFKNVTFLVDFQSLYS